MTGHFTAVLDDGALGTEVSGPLTSAFGILFERGLSIRDRSLDPPGNLNGTSNSNRSNFAATYTYTSTQPTTYQIAGDDFSIGAAGETYQINKIRVWMIYDVAASQYDTATLPPPAFPLTLWVGQAGGSIQPVSANPSKVGCGTPTARTTSGPQTGPGGAFGSWISR